MNCLLDANVLIALADSNHEHHRRAQSWFHSRHSGDSWATCPLTENAFLRILGHPNYRTVRGDTESLRPYLTHICSWPGHQFWPDSISLRDQKRFPKLAGSKILTDLYLLALAMKNHAVLATMDERFDATLVPGGENAILVLPE